VAELKPLAPDGESLREDAEALARRDAPITAPNAGLQPELYVSVDNDQIASALWSEPEEPRIPVVRCTTCGREKALPDQSYPDLCTSDCPGYLDRPWPNR
jgi:hypothetical protein